MTSRLAVAFQTSLPTSSWLSRTLHVSAKAPTYAQVRTPTRCSMRPHLEQLVKLRDLTTEQATDAMSYAVSGDAHDAEVAALLSLLAAKGETAAEVVGIVNALRAHIVPVETDYKVLDIVGTGGDGANTVNISTAASIVAAAAGCKVAKHGSQAVSSKSGSADVLTALGVDIGITPEGVAQCIDKTGIGYMFAPHHHPSLAGIFPVFMAMKIRNVINIVGPLLNPCGAKYLVLGVFKPELLELVADVLIASGVKKAVVVHGAGLDEYSNTGVCDVIEIDGKDKRRIKFDAEAELGIPRVDVQALQGGEPAENAIVIREVLAGRLQGPVTDAIALNAAVGCWVYGLDPTIQDSLERVKGILASGRAVEILDQWVHESHNAAKL